MTAYTLLWFLLAVVHILQTESHTLYNSSTQFNYDPNINDPFGLYNWQYTYRESCGGFTQSPINVLTDRVRYRYFTCPRFYYRTNFLRGTLKNNGHSATFEPQNEVVRLTNVPNRPGVYVLHDFHFHYGGIRGRRSQRIFNNGAMMPGSEHIIDGHRFDGEIHFVFYNAQKYGELEEAEKYPDGLVVISFLVQRVPGVDSLATLRFSQYLNRNIPRVADVDQIINSQIDMRIFFDRPCEFYTYFGSTTTPTCFQAVQWVIFREPVTVTERAWYQLTQLDSLGDFDRLYGNFRNPQPLHGRVVEANFRHYFGPDNHRNGLKMSKTKHKMPMIGLRKSITKKRKLSNIGHPVKMLGNSFIQLPSMQLPKLPPLPRLDYLPTLTQTYTPKQIRGLGVPFLGKRQLTSSAKLGIYPAKSW